ncbi:hypothetical protein [Acetomicrobium sp.]|uniref:hypothetical protein n=1 Tax=Acetomicrobium sp. TaxID=1872099 RepID=UPI002FC5BDDE
MKKILLILFALCITGVPFIAFAALTQQDFIGCSSYGFFYNIVWDGWKGYLTLGPDGKTGELTQSLPSGGPKYFAVRYKITLNPLDSVEGMQGPGNPKSQARLGTGFYFGLTSIILPRTQRMTSDLMGM